VKEKRNHTLNVQEAFFYGEEAIVVAT